VVEHGNKVDGNYHLLLILWEDNADAITSVKIRLFDPERKMFQNRTSPVETLLSFVGGEEDLPQFVPEVVASLESLYDKQFIYNNSTLTITPFFHLADHHAAGIMASVPQGRNIYRDAFSNSNADYYHLVAYQADSFFYQWSFRR